jgi:hypothetical protein
LIRKCSTANCSPIFDNPPVKTFEGITSGFRGDYLFLANEAGLPLHFAAVKEQVGDGGNKFREKGKKEIKKVYKLLGFDI